MNRFYHALIFGLFLGGFGIPGVSYALTLSETIDRLESDKTEEICGALDTMARICDESCVPYVADMMGHHEPEVVLAACRAAQSLANPRLVPPLLNLVRNHPNDEVRIEALKAMTRLGEGYENLLLYLEPDNPDELQRRILRSLPEDLMPKYADLFAHYAGMHAFSTSVAQAYQKRPELLVEALFRELPRANKIQRHNLLRTMAMCTHALDNLELTKKQQNLFWDNPTSEIDSIAIIQAYRSTPDAIRWLLIWAKSIPLDVWYQVLNAIHGPHAELLTDALLKDDSLGFSYRDVQLNADMQQAFLMHLPKSDLGKSVLFETLHREEISANVLRALEKYSDNDQVREIIVHNLGNSNLQAAVTALHIAAQSQTYFEPLANLVLQASSNDNMGHVYLARWALVLLISAFPEQAWPHLDELKHEALKTAGQYKLLHAEPALELCRRLGKMPPQPSESDFKAMRSDMKRAWIRGLEPKTASPILKIALEDSKAAVREQALEYLIRFPESVNDWDEELLDAFLLASLKDADVSVRIAAAVAVGTHARTRFIPELQDLLTHTDIRVAYSALWGLQKMYALPNEAWLKALYYRAPDGILRERLGFLSGYAEKNRELFPMAELDTQKTLKPGQIVQILARDEFLAGHDVAIIQDDQSIRILRTNAFGMMFP
ncbi:MAG: HEAT repeat domain-containing protein [Proteobacteria bacterium]|nr:HEAT repeat domain-containing protein [Pseudomonadota bacterium]